MPLLHRLLCCGLLAAGLVGAETLNVQGIVSFGDSLSDVGNIYLATGGAEAAPPSYTAGQFTDGPDTYPSTSGPTGNWVVQFAAKTGLPAPAPSLLLGTTPYPSPDFAFGGSETLTEYLGVVPSLTDQIQLAGTYLTVNKANINPSSLLYTFWSGANDISSNITSTTVPVQSADAIYQSILTVAAAGGKNFVWVNLPPLGDTPDAMMNGVQQLANQDTTLFNNEFNTDISKLLAAGINVIPVDVNTLFNEIVADNKAGCTVGPADPLCFANVTDPAQGNPVDPNTYLFWDMEHPTTATDALVADATIAAIQDAPEPATLVLGAAGLLGFAFIRRRKMFGN